MFIRNTFDMFLGFSIVLAHEAPFVYKLLLLQLQSSKTFLQCCYQGLKARGRE